MQGTVVFCTAAVAGSFVSADYVRVFRLSHGMAHRFAYLTSIVYVYKCVGGLIRLRWLALQIVLFPSRDSLYACSRSFPVFVLSTSLCLRLFLTDCEPEMKRYVCVCVCVYWQCVDVCRCSSSMYCSSDDTVSRTCHQPHLYTSSASASSWQPCHASRDDSSNRSVTQTDRQTHRHILVCVMRSQG